MSDVPGPEDRADLSGAVDRVLAANLYLVLATRDADGRPWVSPVFFAPVGRDRVVWVSSPAARHSRNVEARPAVATTVFDSSVEVGRAEAAYFDATAARLDPEDAEVALHALNARLPEGKQLETVDIEPDGPMVVYGAEVQRRYALVRGGDPRFANQLDMTVEC